MDRGAISEIRLETEPCLQVQRDLGLTVLLPWRTGLIWIESDKDSSRETIVSLASQESMVQEAGLVKMRALVILYSIEVSKIKKRKTTSESEKCSLLMRTSNRRKYGDLVVLLLPSPKWVKGLTRNSLSRRDPNQAPRRLKRNLGRDQVFKFTLQLIRIPSSRVLQTTSLILLCPTNWDNQSRCLIMIRNSTVRLRVLRITSLKLVCRICGKSLYKRLMTVCQDLKVVTLVQTWTSNSSLRDLYSIRIRHKPSVMNVETRHFVTEMVIKLSNKVIRL